MIVLIDICVLKFETPIGGGGVMVSVLASSAVDRGFEPRWGQMKDYKISICCFRTKHTALRSKRKDCLTLNRDNVSRVELYVYMRTVVTEPAL